MNKTGYKIVFIDIDGVLRDFVVMMKQVFYEDFPDEQVVREDLYDLRQWTSIGDRMFPWVTDGKSAEKIFTQAPEHEDSVRAFQGWLERMDGGFPKFTIVTHQRGDRINWTRQWLEERGILGRLPVFYTIDKVAVMQAVIKEISQKTGVEILPEDCVLLDDNPTELAGAVEAGINVLCIDQSWNQEWEGPRLNHLGEFDPFGQKE